jgi:endoglucanase Acf2
MSAFQRKTRSARRFFTGTILALAAAALMAAIVPVGSGSYTTTFPGTDSAGRNDYPRMQPNLSGAALGKPVPTNDWWSDFTAATFGTNGFNYPFNFNSIPAGIVINDTVPSDTPTQYRQPISDVQAIVMGTDQLAASKASVCNYSDWTVTLSWDDKFFTTLGLGMPFTYYTKASDQLAKVVVNAQYLAGVTINGNKLMILNNLNGSNYVVYAPAGSTWTGSGGAYTSTLNGQNYWSMVMLPAGVNVTTAASDLEQYAYVFPGDTQATWTYTPATGVVRTTFTVTPDIKEGVYGTVLQGLLPHQWGHLAADSPQPGAYAYKTVRGQMKMLASNTFFVENRFSGILPTLPNLGKYSAAFNDVAGFSPAALAAKLDLLKNDTMPLWTDSYNDGQLMNQLVQAARIADQLGYTSARDSLVNTVRQRLEDWFTATPGEVAFLFYYDAQWTALIGYPAGYSQDSNLNDHHYHWGYFINAASVVAQFTPGWADQWGGMVEMLARDTASPSRTDPMFPYLRNFSPYEGHSWANGMANEPFGVDEESSPESLNCEAALITWGLVTGNDQLRDLGVYLYSTEESAVEEYWFDVNRRTFQPAYQYPMVARIWAGGYDNGTWWSPSLSACYGIQMYPIHGASLYLGYHPDYVQRVWTGVTADTGVMSNLTADATTGDPNLWYDVFWCYQSFYDPKGALEGYTRWPGRTLKFGISDAQTYHWLHTMNVLGQVQQGISADDPAAAVFLSAGVKTYVAHNFGAQPITVTFSDGTTLPVPAQSMATSQDLAAGATLAASAAQIATLGTLDLTATVTGAGVTKVEFYQDGVLLGSRTAAPYTFTTAPLAAALCRFYAKVYVGSGFNLSNVVLVQVGGSIPYGGTAPVLPGTLQAGNYDQYEGGNGNGITYFDDTPGNASGSGFRPGEDVDAAIDPVEGAYVGWIDPGEWLTYTVNVSQAGNYTLTVDTTSGTAGGGGPFWLECNGVQISPNILVPFTDSNWTVWQSTTVPGINLAAGIQVLKLMVGNSNFNLGRMTFALGNPVAPSITTQPANLTVFAGASATFTVTAAGTAPLNYQWQLNGAAINGATAASYSIPVTTTADSGKVFKVLVSNTVNQVLSDPATLTVDPVKSLDLNGDHTVDVLDLAFLASVYGTVNATADLDSSGLVDDADILLLLAGF